MNWIYREYQNNWNAMSSKTRLTFDGDKAKQILEDLEIAIHHDMWASASHRFSDSDTLIVRRATEFEYWLDDGFCEHKLSRDKFLSYVETALVVAGIEE